MTEEMEVISISEIVEAIKKRWKIVAISTLVTTLIAVILSFFVISPTYEASTKVFIGKEESNMEGYSYNDITMYQKLLTTYSELVKTKDLVNRAIANSKYDLKITEVLNSVSVSTVSDTQMIKISYKSISPEIAKDMLESLTNEFIVTAQELVPNGNVRVLENVELPEKPVAPNKKMNIAIAFLLGAMVGFGIVFLLEYLDNTYKSKEQLERDLDIPVLGIIPMSDFE